MGPRGGLWLNWKPNQKLLRNLKEEFGTKEFTNKDAYETYAEHHSLWSKNPYDEWLQMNVRNSLCAAAVKGQLIRVANGKYRFEE